MVEDQICGGAALTTGPKRFGATVFALIIVLVVYEIWRVIEARAATPEIFARVERIADPQVSQLRPEITDILIKIEDPTFWDNDGIDFTTPGQGLTTLTQALAKRLYFEHFTPGLAKIELILIAKFALTPLVSKEDILSAFLTTAYLGQDSSGAVIGFSNAAQRWYGKDLRALSVEEFTGLVAMLPSPNTLDPERHPLKNQDRVYKIKRLLAGQCTPKNLFDVDLVGCENR